MRAIIQINNPSNVASRACNHIEIPLHDKIKSRLNSKNACYSSMKNLYLCIFYYKT